MRLSQVSVLLLAFFGCVYFSAATKTSGYLYTSDPAAAGNLLKDAPSSGVFNDNDLKQLIAHNLGVLDYSADLQDSSKEAISKYGNKALMKPQRLNYLFLLESAFPEPLNTEKLFFSKLKIKHRNAFFDVCNSNEVDKCILDLLYDTTQENSLVNILKQNAPKNDVEAYYYSTEPNTAYSYAESLLSLKEDQKGNLIILDNGSDEVFKLKTDLGQCLNNIVGTEFSINLAERSITPKYDGAPAIVIDAVNEEQFTQFVNDICSIVSISKLIRKNPQPTLFTFYVNSLAKLESLVSDEQKTVLYHIFNLAYQQFIHNIQKRYESDEIGGQLFVLSNENNLGKKYETEANKKKAESGATDAHVTSLIQVRKLEQAPAAKTDASKTAAKTSTATKTSNNNTLIFKSVLIAFMLITLWVCIEMFEIDIQKDSLVYAKFLAADYFRR